jgi:hypothetical protein
MDFSANFFALNFAYAHRIASITGMELEQALLEHTYFYLALGLGRDFNPDHPLWREFLIATSNLETQISQAHNFYLARRLPKALPPMDQSCGCFYYCVWVNGRIRLHFRNTEEGTIGPLSPVRFQLRRTELYELISHIRQDVREARTLVGGSWLYHMQAYRQLFPPAFLQTAVPSHLPEEAHYLTLWGQFVNRLGEVRLAEARAFLVELEKAKSVEESMLHLEAPLEVFDVG